MSFEPRQIQMICLEDLVLENHIYRKFLSLFNMDVARAELKKLEAESDYNGYRIYRIFLCLLLQFLEDLSDRELERFICDNSAARWFCQFDLTAKTPDHSAFGRVRSRIRTNKLSKIFSLLCDQLKAHGYMSEVFTFVVDMQSGMINKVAVTPANIIDSKGFKHIAPNQGAVYADKGYCDKNAKITAQTKNFHLIAVKKNNMKSKNSDLDSYYTKLRAPFEHVFSKQNKRVRYKGLAKNQFSAFMQAITFNFKRLPVLSTSASPPMMT